MKNIRYPRPLQPGDAIGITSPSAGFGAELEQRYRLCCKTLSDLGYAIREGECLRSDAMVSASTNIRAAELQQMLLDDSLSAIIPPWGGELLINILPLLQFDLMAQATPKWVVGYSDLTTLMLPLTLLTGIATAHGSNLLETPMQANDGHLHWTQALQLTHGSTFTQYAAPFMRDVFEDWGNHPNASAWKCAAPAQWKVLHHENNPAYSCVVSGRLIGGCLDVVSMLPGTPYGQVQQFAADYAPDGLLVYLENVDGNTAGYSRMLSCIRLSGWLDNANALLLGRSAGAQLREFTERDAILAAVGDLAIPVFYDLDIGHVPPQMMLINGAVATLRYDAEHNSVTQSLV